jgi:hypothetical protein
MPRATSAGRPEQYRRRASEPSTRAIAAVRSPVVTANAISTGIICGIGSTAARPAPITSRCSARITGCCTRAASTSCATKAARCDSSRTTDDRSRGRAIRSRTSSTTMLARRRQRIPHVSSGTFHVMTNDQIKIDGDNGHWQFLERQSVSDISPAAALNARRHAQRATAVDSAPKSTTSPRRCARSCATPSAEAPVCQI